MQTKKQNKDEFYMWLNVLHSLRIRGLSFGKIAKMHGVDKSNFTRVKHQRCPKYERLISEAIGLPPWLLWPGRYDENHEPSATSLIYHKKEFIEHRIKKMRERKEKIGKKDHDRAG
jgi:Ner family transcriptional regulator